MTSLHTRVFFFNRGKLSGVERNNQKEAWDMGWLSIFNKKMEKKVWEINPLKIIWRLRGRTGTGTQRMSNLLAVLLHGLCFWNRHYQTQQVTKQMCALPCSVCEFPLPHAFTNTWYHKIFEYFLIQIAKSSILLFQFVFPRFLAIFNIFL